MNRNSLVAQAITCIICLFFISCHASSWSEVMDLLNLRVMSSNEIIQLHEDVTNAATDANTLNTRSRLLVILNAMINEPARWLPDDFAAVLERRLPFLRCTTRRGLVTHNICLTPTDLLLVVAVATSRDAMNTMAILDVEDRVSSSLIVSEVAAVAGLTTEPRLLAIVCIVLAARIWNPIDSKPNLMNLSDEFEDLSNVWETYREWGGTWNIVSFHTLWSHIMALKIASTIENYCLVVHMWEAEAWALAQRHAQTMMSFSQTVYGRNAVPHLVVQLAVLRDIIECCMQGNSLVMMMETEQLIHEASIIRSWKMYIDHCGMRVACTNSHMIGWFQLSYSSWQMFLRAIQILFPVTLNVHQFKGHLNMYLEFCKRKRRWCATMRNSSRVCLPVRFDFRSVLPRSIIQENRMFVHQSHRVAQLLGTDPVVAYFILRQAFGQVWAVEAGCHTHRSGRCNAWMVLRALQLEEAWDCASSVVLHSLVHAHCDRGDLSFETAVLLVFALRAVGIPMSQHLSNRYSAWTAFNCASARIRAAVEYFRMSATDHVGLTAMAFAVLVMYPLDQNGCNIFSESSQEEVATAVTTFFQKKYPNIDSSEFDILHSFGRVAHHGVESIVAAHLACRDYEMLSKRADAIHRLELRAQERKRRDEVISQMGDLVSSTVDDVSTGVDVHMQLGFRGRHVSEQQELTSTRMCVGSSKVLDSELEIEEDEIDPVMKSSLFNMHALEQPQRIRYKPIYASGSDILDSELEEIVDLSDLSLGAFSIFQSGRTDLMNEVVQPELKHDTWYDIMEIISPQRNVSRWSSFGELFLNQLLPTEATEESVKATMQKLCFSRDFCDRFLEIAFEHNAELSRDELLQEMARALEINDPRLQVPHSVSSKIYNWFCCID